MGAPPASFLGWGGVMNLMCFCFQFLAFPCGLIRGALANLGLTCTVTADVLSMPSCEYKPCL